MRPQGLPMQGGSISELRSCAGCGMPFLARRWNQLKHSKNCGDKRTPMQRQAARTRRRAEPIEFIGVDGEAWKDAVTQEHIYGLLFCGDKHIDAEGAKLHLGEILEFLWHEYEEHPNAAFVGFYLSYDWGQ